MPYAVTLALQSIAREKWITLLSVLTIASGLLVMSVAFFIVYNIEEAAGHLPERFSMVIYLDAGLPRENADQIAATLRRNRSVSSLRYIPKEEALKELKSVLKNSSYIVDGLGENPLPDSMEVKLRKEAVGTEGAKNLAGEVMKIKGVKEVDYGEKFLSTLEYLKVGMKTIGLTLVICLAAGIVFVCYSTVKILFYRRSEEIETFKLLGATKRFIRMPFLLEGTAIGAAGGIISLAGVLAFYYLVLLRLTVTMPVFGAVLFPMNFFLLLPLAGMFLGLTGSAIALGRIRY